MATFELPDIPPPRVTPTLLVGAASPLWGYFGAATAGGVAWWWMTRWARPRNLEALFDRAAEVLPAVAAELAEPMVEAVEAAAAVVEATIEAVESELPPAPVGGEAAPISPVVEMIAAPPEPPSAEEPSSEPAELEGARPRGRKAPNPNGSDAQP